MLMRSRNVGLRSVKNHGPPYVCCVNANLMSGASHAKRGEMYSTWWKSSQAPRPSSQRRPQGAVVLTLVHWCHKQFITVSGISTERLSAVAPCNVTAHHVPGGVFPSIQQCSPPVHVMASQCIENNVKIVRVKFFIFSLSTKNNYNSS